MNLTPCETQTPCVWHFVLCCAERRNARGATFARLAGKRAFRLGFARLSAPRALCARSAQGSKPCFVKQKRTPDGVLFCLSMGDKKDIFAFFRLGLNCRVSIIPKVCISSMQKNIFTMDLKHRFFYKALLKCCHNIIKIFYVSYENCNYRITVARAIRYAVGMIYIVSI